MKLVLPQNFLGAVSVVLVKVQKKTGNAKRKNRYSICLVLSAIASILSIATPLLTALIVKNIINNCNMKGIVPSLAAMAFIKGTRSLLRGRVNKLLLDVQPRTPLAKLRELISGRLFFVEPLVDKLGAFGMFITKLTGGVKVKVSAAAASLFTDIVNIILSGAAFYFTQSYVLSVLVSFVIPTFFVIPLFSKDKKKQHDLTNPVKVRCY